LLQRKTAVFRWGWVTVVLKNNQPKKKEQEVVASALNAYLADFEKKKR
jgi:hypothetical protein